MFNLEHYATKYFEVKCHTGVVASSIDGKIIPKDKFGEDIPPDDERFIKAKKKNRAVNKKTAECYFTKVYSAGPGYIEFCIIKADHLCRHGLNWDTIYTATLGFEKYELVEKGTGTLEYWLGRTIPDDLLMPKEGYEEPEGSDIGKIVGINDFLTFYGTEVTIEKIFRAYESGEFYGRTGFVDRDMRKLQFGVEIEFTGMTREAAAKYVARFFESVYSRPSFTVYDRYCIVDGKGRIWSVKNDSSINNPVDYYNEPADEKNRCELETPILEYKDIETLQKLVRGLRKDRYMRVNSSCGIHVHVGGKFDAITLKNAYNLIASHQKLLTRALKVKKGRLERYCKQVSGNAYKNCTNKSLDMSIVKRQWEYFEEDRYRIINLCSFFMNKGIEFRLFNSTTHAGAIKSYIQFSLALCAYAMSVENVRPGEKELGHDLTRMRNWLHTLGLVGDEFKSCRYHLTKNLENNKVSSSSRTNRGLSDHVA